MSRPIAIVVSEAQPLTGQTQRSSGNFSSNWYGNTMNCKVVVSDNANAGIIVFDIKQDNQGNDPTIRQNVKNGDTFTISSRDNLYIANAVNANGHTFTVTFASA